MKGKIFGAAALGAALGALALYKIGEKELKKNPATQEVDEDLDALFDEDKDIDVFDDDKVTIGDIAAEAAESAKEVGKTIKVGFDKTVEKAKEEYAEYKEDPEAFKGKVKERATEYKGKAKDFASEKIEDAKDFASDKYENAKDFIKSKFDNLDDNDFYDDALEDEIEETDEAVEDIIDKAKKK